MAIMITLIMSMARMATPMTEARDWHSDPIDDDTVIESRYRDTQNVHRFFKAQIGNHFRFDRPFMAWMKTHAGSTMCEAVAESRLSEAAT